MAKAEFYVSNGSKFRPSGTIHRVLWAGNNYYISCAPPGGARGLPYGRLEESVETIAAPFCKNCFPLQESV